MGCVARAAASVVPNVNAARQVIDPVGMSSRFMPACVTASSTDDM